MNQHAMNGKGESDGKEDEVQSDSEEDKVHQRLDRVVNFLNKHSVFAGDNLSWAANCIKSYLDKNERTLDHAFGLRSSKRGPKPMAEGTHDDWVVSAWQAVVEKAPAGMDFPDTKTMADIGRYYGLGGRDSATAEDHAVASELKRILARYLAIIVKQLSDSVESHWKDE